MSVKARLYKLEDEITAIDEDSVVLQTCNASLSSLHWTWDEPAAQYILNAKNHKCLNTYGCGRDTNVLTYTCEVPPTPPSCGKTFGNLQWSLVGQQLIVNSTGQCVTAKSAKEIVMADCVAEQPSQQWSYDSNTGLLKSTATDQCLGLPVPSRYLKICGRVRQYVAFDNVLDAICFQINTTGNWSLLVTDEIVQSGIIDIDEFDPYQWYTYSLSFIGEILTASINGTQIMSAPATIPHGQVALGSGHHGAQFDDFFVEKAGA